MLGLPDESSSKIIVAQATALLGGLVVAVFNWVITRKKTAADTALATLEAEKLRRELQGINSSIRVVSAKISQGDRISGPSFESRFSIASCKTGPQRLWCPVARSRAFADQYQNQLT